MSDMMKEVVVTGAHAYEVRTVPRPEVKGDYDVLVQMKAAGVCGSDFHIYNGSNPCASYPRIPGHENAGVVAAVGSKVTKVKPGDHIIVDLIHTCGTCYQCRIHRKNVCENVLVRGSGYDGGWREYFIVPEGEVYPISSDVPWKDAALVEPLQSAHIARKEGAWYLMIRFLYWGLGRLALSFYKHVRQRALKRLFVLISVIVH